VVDDAGEAAAVVGAEAEALGAEALGAAEAAGAETVGEDGVVDPVAATAGEVVDVEKMMSLPTELAAWVLTPTADCEFWP
jgi:hypothetical protein